jgi:hypothetical protein
MKKTIIIFCLTFIIFACAANPVISVVGKKTETAGCEALGIVEAEGRSLGDIEVKLMKATQKKGGNVLLFYGGAALEITLHVPKDQHLKAFGEAYFCSRGNST